MSAQPDGLLEIGRIRKAHGVRGEVAVHLYSERPERLAPGARWYARDGWLTVDAARPSGDRWLVRLAEIGDRGAAQRYTGAVIYAEPIDDPDALWVHELIGSRIVEADGTERGRCTAVVANPASDLLELDSGVLVPTVFVTEHVDGVVTIDPPDGLFPPAETSTSEADA